MAKKVEKNNKFKNMQKNVTKMDSNKVLKSNTKRSFNSSNLPKKYCPTCGNPIETFLPFNNRKNVLCPECSSLERHRFLYYFMKYKTQLFSKNINFLDLTSESPINDNMPKNINYFELNEIEKTNFLKSKKLPFKNNSFNIIYSYHVFDNHYYDKSILKEIYRVLKSTPNKTFFIMYVIDLNDNHDIININNHEEIYGYNFIEMLNESGFNANLHSISSLVNNNTIKKYGLSKNDHVFICNKRRG